jgi:oligoribonuclease (3'-5' exoribonuclease)
MLENWIETFVCMLSDLSISARPRRLAFKKMPIVKEFILYHMATCALLTENTGPLEVLMS